MGITTEPVVHKINTADGYVFVWYTWFLSKVDIAVKRNGNSSEKPENRERFYCTSSSTNSTHHTKYYYSLQRILLLKFHWTKYDEVIWLSNKNKPE